jgi:hypothetical protein
MQIVFAMILNSSAPTLKQLSCHGRRHIDFQIRMNLDPFMIHETFLTLLKLLSEAIRVA